MPRRGENIFKRKDGRWEGRYKKGKNSAGKTLYGSIYAHTYKEVRRKLDDKKTELTHNPQKSEVLLFRDASSQWMQMLHINLKESTIVKYQNLLKNHILPQFGTYEISSITTSDLEKFVYQKMQQGRLDGGGGLSGKTVKDMMTVVYGILRYAQKNNITLSCSVAGIPIRKTEQVLPIITCENLDILEQYLHENESLRNIGVLICLYMGLRIGELCALQWKNILLEEKIIRVYFTMQRLQKLSENSEVKTKIVITPPKSELSTREIPIPDFLAEILKKYEVKNGEAFFLTGKDNSFIEPRTYQAYFSRLIEKVNVPHVNFHALRHTFATRCIDAGVDAKTLSEILGHSKVNTTLERYVHITMDMKRKNMEKMTDIYVH